MDKLRKAIKCVECSQVLESPVLLPCSHSICDKHVKIGDKKSIRCGECGLEHQIPENIGFPKIQSLEDIIEAKIGLLDFGVTHTEAKEQCKKIDNLIKSIELLVNDPLVYAYEEIDQLINRVEIKSEKLKLIIDEKTEEMIYLLNKFKNKLAVNNKNSFAKKKSSFDELKSKSQSDLTLWQNELNEVKFDEKRWKVILCESKKTIQSLETFLALFKAKIFSGEDTFYRAKVDLFEEIVIKYFRFDIYNNDYSPSDFILSD